MKFATIKPGDTIYECQNTQQGNTMCRAMSTWKIKVIDVYDTGALVSWNGNRPKVEPRGYFEHSTIRRLPHEFVRREIFGEATCHFCRRTREQGHAEDCGFPVNKRKRRTL